MTLTSHQAVNAPKASLRPAFNSADLGLNNSPQMAITVAHAAQAISAQASQAPAARSMVSAGGQGRRVAARIPAVMKPRPHSVPATFELRGASISSSAATIAIKIGRADIVMDYRRLKYGDWDMGGYLRMVFVFWSSIQCFLRLSGYWNRFFTNTPCLQRKVSGSALTPLALTT